MRRNNGIASALALRFIGMAVCIIPAAIATLSYFPLWIARDDASVLSGISLILIAISIIPLLKYVKAVFASPSAHTVWLIAFISFFLLSKIANEITVISFVGFVSNLIGAFIFKAAEKTGKREKDNEGKL